MDEAHLSNLQRKRILDDHVNNGIPLPVTKEGPCLPTRERCFTADFRKAYDAKKRSLDIIKSSGAFEVSPHTVFGPYREPTHIAKKRLQEKMSGMKGTPRKVKSRASHQNAIGELDELTEVYQQIQERKKQICKCNSLRMLIEWNYVTVLDEISERASWLDEMEKLGQGRQHRSVIQNQITEKFREIKRLEVVQHELESRKCLEGKLDKLTL